MKKQLPFESKKKEILVKNKAKTDPKLGRDPNRLDVSELIEYGIVNLDKPKGPTSHLVSDYLQKIIGIKKAGHSGTLDPAVTGVLPTALGKATRIVQALLKAGKEYVCIMHLHKEVDKSKLKKAFKKFRGKIKQKPPIKSAVKRVERFREVYYVEILEIDGKDILFKIGCEAGTYIRKYCHDIGADLGVGAHMAELRRTQAGPFKEDTLVTLQDLTDAFWYWKNEKKEEDIRKCILPIETAVEHLPKVWVFDQTVDSICHGVELKVPGISKLHDRIEPDQIVALMTLKDELIGIGIAKLSSAKIMKEEKGIAVKIEKVFMQIGLYTR